jgi:hypothetical protein
MKLATLVLCPVVLLLAVAASAQEVHVDYNKLTDFTKFHTYAWGKLPNPNSITSPQLAAEAQNQINQQLQVRGLKMVDESQSPDLVVVASGAQKMQTFYSDYDPSGTIMTSGTDLGEASQKLTGALVVDLYNVQAKHLIWRATAIGVLNQKNPSKNIKLVDQAVSKMFKEYPSLPPK